jgi:DNA-binding LacI/PurR family transcriptional regulator
MTRRLAEVAKKVGVSEATVSRVLNGKPGVSESTREAVLTALDVLGYERPTQLRGDRGRLVGLVLPELQNPIFPAFAEVVGGALAQQGFTPVLCTRTPAASPRPSTWNCCCSTRSAGSSSPAGSTPRPTRRTRTTAASSSGRLPAVLINAAIDQLDFPRVSCDDAVAVEQALGHLLALGHTRVGMVLAPPDHIPSRRKEAAFRRPPPRPGSRSRTARSSTACSRSRAARRPPPG